ncbi:phosphoadenylyl-sulfate reductase [Phycicoccus duodecadis]|uniref:Adenosine 5'-phosphosulfate reductase n=1 Tax=Phycicoccus duodecadis TaxID=173053 RepID=A0A2N3YFA1_9MICO|nr:phosphoadenylyl-sulfate reductase [Phycicoccus duodecadis]PKW25542.1 phosphoadenylylsulfate reductase (thioredoxin) [Phycicoccus duodecadis]
MTAVATRTRRSTDQLRALAHDGQRLVGEGSADEVVAWAARTFPGTLAVASSMETGVLPHLVSQHAPGVDVLFLDTGYHFAETLGARDEVDLTLDVTVVDVRARLSVAEQDARFGPRLHDRDPASCCRMRKVEPLREALTGYECWMSGVRRDESAARADTPLVTFDETNGIVKVNPLAAWTHDRMLGYGLMHRVPVNLLLSDEYPSIGCAPCTARVEPGADPRSGRWAGLDKTECGIHQ